MPKKIGDLKLYDIHELAEIMGVTAVTLRSYLRRGQLRGRKMGVTWYVTEEALREYFAGNPETAPKKRQGQRKKA